MGLIICCACDRQRERRPIKRGGNVRCSNCGAYGPRIIYRRKVWADWAERDGLERMEARRRTFAGLRWIVESKGYKPGWSAVKFKALFGEWPDGLDVPIYEPTQGLLDWIRRSNARWKAARKKMEGACLGVSTLNGEIEPSVTLASTRPPTFSINAPSPLMTVEDWEVDL